MTTINIHSANMDTAKNAILAAPASYPGVMMGLLAVLVIIIIYMWWSGRSPSKEKAVSKRTKKEPTDDEEAEVDELIEEIHDKQKKKKGTGREAKASVQSSLR